MKKNTSISLSQIAMAIKTLKNVSKIKTKQVQNKCKVLKIETNSIFL